jgi:hypothetical protein
MEASKSFSKTREIVDMAIYSGACIRSFRKSMCSVHGQTRRHGQRATMDRIHLFGSVGVKANTTWIRFPRLFPIFPLEKRDIPCWPTAMLHRCFDGSAQSLSRTHQLADQHKHSQPFLSVAMIRRGLRCYPSNQREMLPLQPHTVR